MHSKRVPGDPGICLLDCMCTNCPAHITNQAIICSTCVVRKQNLPHEVDCLGRLAPCSRPGAHQKLLSVRDRRNKLAVRSVEQKHNKASCMSHLQRAECSNLSTDAKLGCRGLHIIYSMILILFCLHEVTMVRNKTTSEHFYLLEKALFSAFCRLCGSKGCETKCLITVQSSFRL